MLDNILTFGSVYFNSIKIDIFVTFVFVFREILTTALREGKLLGTPGVP